MPRARIKRVLAEWSIFGTPKYAKLLALALPLLAIAVVMSTIGIEGDGTVAGLDSHAQSSPSPEPTPRTMTVFKVKPPHGGLNVRAEPALAATIICTLSPDDVFVGDASRQLESDGDRMWRYVSRDEKCEGWVSNGYIVRDRE